MRRLLKQENKMNYNSRESSSKMSKKKKKSKTTNHLLISSQELFAGLKHILMLGMD